MRKIAVCLLSVILTLSVLGCSSDSLNPKGSLKGKSGFSVFELEGKKYDMSGDVDETISTLAKSGFAFVNTRALPSIEYSDNNGELVRESYLDYIQDDSFLYPIILYAKYQTPLHPDIKQHHFAYYGFFPAYPSSALFDYESPHGITNKSTAEDIESLEGFLSCFSFGNPNAKAIGYFALYVDGVQINMSDYRDELESILSFGSPDSSAIEAIMSYPYSNLLSNQTMPGVFWGRVENRIRNATLSDLETIFEEDKRYKYSLLASLATAEALQRVFDGKANTIEIYIYTDNEYGPITDYLVFNADTMLNQEETP